MSKDNIVSLSREQGVEVGYTSRVFVQALFPYRKTDSRERMITHGADQITVYSIKGLPYGKYPRLIMAYIITTAVEQARQAEAGIISEDQARKISLGRSMNTFLQTLGITTRGNGGTRGNLTALREQLLRLASSTITVERRTAKRSRGTHANIVESWDLWLGEETSAEAYILITQSFYDHIRQSPIPIDLAVFTQLNQPRAMDLYVWLTMKKFWISATAYDHFLFPWSDIESYFSLTDLVTATQRRDFRKEIAKAIERITTYWPDAQASTTTDGVLIYKGPPSIPPRPGSPPIPNQTKIT